MITTSNIATSNEVILPQPKTLTGFDGIISYEVVYSIENAKGAFNSFRCNLLAFDNDDVQDFLGRLHKQTPEISELSRLGYIHGISSSVLKQIVIANKEYVKKILIKNEEKKPLKKKMWGKR